MRGRKPKSTELQIAEGDPRKLGKRKLQAKLEARPPATKGLPGCPQHLQGIARKQWGIWADELDQMGVAHRGDAVMLEGACVNYARAVQADEQAQKLGDVVDEPVMSKEGECVGFRQRNNLWAGVRDRSWTLVKGFCSEFGLTPVSLERLTIEKKDDGAQDLAHLLSQPRQQRVPVN